MSTCCTIRTMPTAYSGPLRDEPPAVELHNTLYAVAGEMVDGLADARSSRAWLHGLQLRLPGASDLPGAWPRPAELIDLRDVVRPMLHAAMSGDAYDPLGLEEISRAAGRAPRSPVVRLSGGLPVAATDYHGASRSDLVIAALAADAIDLVTGPRRGALRACGAPGCVLMFLKDHPRREWCSNACGNRARQARHYDRARRRS